MKITKSERIAIYFYYDEYGIVDEYALYFIKGLREIAGYVLVVVNGFITDESKEKLLKISDDLLIRPNEGYDAWAYKDAFNHIGWEQLEKYEEVVYCNSTVFGPIYPFEEMFGKMSENDDLDFWGISFHPDMESSSTCNPYGYIPEHVQHYFVVWRKRFTKAPELKKYWEELPPIRNYAETVGLHETVFTKYFQDLGFRWTTYVRYVLEEESSNYLLLYEPLKALEKYRCPVIKRKLFFLEDKYVTSNSIGERVRDTLDYLETYKLYDVDLIYRNIIRTTDQACFINAFGLWKVLPEKDETYGQKKDSELFSRAAVIYFCVDQEDQAFVRRLEKVLQDQVRIFRIVLEDYTEEGLKEVLFSIASQYDYVCTCNNKRFPEKQFHTSRRSAEEIEFRSVLASLTYVRNVLNAFQENQRVGLFMPMKPLIAEIAKGQDETDWTEIYKTAKRFKEKLDLRVILTRDAFPISGHGYFWFRGSVLRKFLERNLPSFVLTKEESLALTGLVPYAVQAEGLMPAYITTDQVVSYQLSSMNYYVKRGRDEK